jgi:hypothetical protein
MGSDILIPSWLHCGPEARLKHYGMEWIKAAHLKMVREERETEKQRETERGRGDRKEGREGGRKKERVWEQDIPFKGMKPTASSNKTLLPNTPFSCELTDKLIHCCNYCLRDSTTSQQHYLLRVKPQQGDFWWPLHTQTVIVG